MKKVNWRVYERDHIYPQSLAAYLDLLKLAPSAKYPYIAKYYEVVSFIGDYFWWARDLDKLEVAFRRWMNIWLRYPAKYRQFFKKFRNSHIKVQRVMPNLKDKTKHLKTLSNFELYGLYYQAKEVLLHNLFLSEYTVDLFDDFFNQILTEKINQISQNEIDFADLQKLLRPASTSEIFLYRKRLLELSLKNKVSFNTLTSVADHFSWIMMSWDGSNEMTYRRVQREISALKKKSEKQRRKELVGIEKFTQSVKAQRVRIIKQYRLPFRKLTPYFHLLDTFILLHDWRKGAQMRCNQVILRVLQEVSKRFSIQYQNLLWYLNPEIEKLCLRNKKVAQAVIRRRKNGLTWVICRGKINQYQGQAAKRVLKRLVLSVQKAKQASEVSGIPASHGQAKGRAYVVKSAKEAVEALKRGGILVTSMTTVDYLPAMRKASAIVTDDGGLTCHAAIVSRELGIPCVVGTKIATQVFKSGDRVKVDAMKGVVRKL